jgi:hypothetical protein
MKTVFITFCLTTCMLSAYSFEEEKFEYAHAWSPADPVIALLLLVCIWQVALARWRVDGTSVFLWCNSLVLGISGMLNGKLGNGTLLNFGRTSLAGWVLYTIMSNVIRSPRHLRHFSSFCVICTVVIYGLSIPNLSAAWAGSFTNLVNTFGIVDLNSYGFLFVLLFCASAPLWLSWSDIIRGLVVGGGLACGAFISLSRSAWANLVIASSIIFVLRDIAASRGRIARGVTLLLVFGLAGLAINRLAQALPGAAQFGQAKLDDFGDDFVNTRLVALTLVPIKEWAQQPVSTLVWGDAVTFQHTFLANAIWVTGLLGLICGLGIYCSMLRTGWLAWRRSRTPQYKLAAACYLAITVAMVLDDSATNHRYHSQLLSYLFFTSGGAFAGALRKTNWNDNKTIARNPIMFSEAEAREGVTELA